MKEFNGSITLSRPMYSDGSKKIIVCIESQDSGRRIVQAELDFDSFAEMMTGRGDNHCNLKLWDNYDLADCTREADSKVLDFTLNSSGEVDEQEYDRVFAKHEVNGWKGSRSDLTNHHYIRAFNKNGIRSIKVNFHRYVNPEGEPQLV